MPKRSRKKPRDRDPNEIAARVIEEATGQPSSPPEKNPAAVALGRLGGKKGGLARAKKLTKKQRIEIAKNAANARWKKERS